MINLNQHQAIVHDMANKVDQLIIDLTVRTRFIDHIDQFCKMTENYGQALQPYADDLKKAEERIKKFTPEQLEKYRLPNGKIEDTLINECPPPKDWVNMNYWDNPFINVDMGVIFRPAEPVNPLLWFGIFGNSNLQRKATESEKIMCDYVRMAIIHDCELRYSGTPTDTPIFSDKYDGKWFQRDQFNKEVWTYYHYSNQGSIATDQEKQSQLNRAFEHVQADIASMNQSGKAGGDVGEKEIIEIKPSWFGVSIDLKEVWRRIKRKFKR